MCKVHIYMYIYFKMHEHDNLCILCAKVNTKLYIYAGRRCCYLFKIKKLISGLYISAL